MTRQLLDDLLIHTTLEESGCRCSPKAVIGVSALHSCLRSDSFDNFFQRVYPQRLISIPGRGCQSVGTETEFVQSL